MANAINWFEIPVTDMPRAVAFYSAILGAEISADPAAPGYQMAVLPYQDGVGGVFFLRICQKPVSLLRMVLRIDVSRGGQPGCDDDGWGATAALAAPRLLRCWRCAGAA